VVLSAYEGAAWCSARMRVCRGAECSGMLQRVSVLCV